MSNEIYNPSRRDFLKGVTIGAGGYAFGSMLIHPKEAMAQSRPSGKMMLCMHQNTSRGAGYRKSLEGWAKAGIKYVELTDGMLDEFVKTDTLAAAKNVLADLGLTAVSASAVLEDVLRRRQSVGFDEFVQHPVREFDVFDARLRPTFEGLTVSRSPRCVLVHTQHHLA